jgi:hypothetical protein
MACRVVERILGATAQAWDVQGRQNAVDAMLTLPDGRRGALEITRVDTGQGLHLEGELARSGFHLPAVGQWWWDVTLESVRDLPELRERYARLITLSESLGAIRPEHIRWQTGLYNADLTWLAEHPGVSMLGYPNIPAREGDRVRDVMVMPGGSGGMVDHSMSGLRVMLQQLFAGARHMPKHLAKTAAAPADERHLFVVLHSSALPFAMSDALARSSEVPDEEPPLVEGITHLWLAPPYSERILLWGSGHWQQFFPYDAAGTARGDWTGPTS